MSRRHDTNDPPPPGVHDFGSQNGPHARRWPALSLLLILLMIPAPFIVVIGLSTIFGALGLLNFWNEDSLASALAFTVLLLSFPITIAACIFLFIRLSRRPYRKDLAHITAHGFLLCPHCRYDLRGTPPAGRCPECAAVYTHDVLRRSWLWTYRAALSPAQRRAAAAGDPDFAPHIA